MHTIEYTQNSKGQWMFQVFEDGLELLRSMPFIDRESAEKAAQAISMCSACGKRL